MKIDSEQLLPTVQRLKTEHSAKGESSPDVVAGAVRHGSDRVELSGNMAKVDKLKTIMQQMSDGQSEKVAKLKQQIADGSYQVAASEVAGKMLDRWRDLNVK